MTIPVCHQLLNEMQWYCTQCCMLLMNVSCSFKVHSNCVAVPIYWFLSAASHRSIIAFQVKMNLTFMRHGNAVTLQFLCRTVQCDNAMQLWCSMNGPLDSFPNFCWLKYYIFTLCIENVAFCHCVGYVKGALDNIWKFSFWLNFIYQVKSDCKFTNSNRKIQQFLQKVKKSSVFVKHA